MAKSLTPEAMRPLVVWPNARLSEHEHYGPHEHLELITWSEAKFDGHGLHGTLDDFRRLADLVERLLTDATPGQTFDIDEMSSGKTDYTFRIEIAPDDFNPPTKDRYLRAQEESVS